MSQGKNILVCPLDWGLGHAARMVPVINLINKLGANAIIAANNGPLEFLKQCFPDIKTIKFNGYSPKYPSDGSMAMAMIKSLPKMILESNSAHNELQKLIGKHNIDAVISDNRYELSTSKVPSVFVTHQLNIQTSGWQIAAKPLINGILSHFLNKFDEIWIPDVTSNFRLSGNLSETNSFKSKLFNIGLLSRFSNSLITNYQETIDLLIILSGPEPQRTILEKLLLSQAQSTELKTVMLLAKPSEQIDKVVKNVRLISHLQDSEFAKLIQSSKIIVSRPGYSTLMDLAVFNKKAIFIPTPGQTEQEYLAKRLFNKGIAYTQTQNNFVLKEALLKQNQFKSLFMVNEPELLETRMKNLLKNY